MKAPPNMEKTEKTLNITSEHASEFEASVLIGNDRYIVQTEDLGSKRHEVVTSVYLRGEIVKSVRSDYGGMDGAGLEERLYRLMERQHKNALRELREESDKTPAEYLEELKTLLRKKKNSPAFHLLGEAIENYPDDPFLLSYYGAALAQTGKRHEEGVRTCRKALKRLKATVPFGEEIYYPMFYLNLGRACLAGGDKEEAVKAFKEGLKADPKHSDLIWEMKKLGERKSPPVSFLSRGNPINKYIGIIRRKIGK